VKSPAALHLPAARHDTESTSASLPVLSAAVPGTSSAAPHVPLRSLVVESEMTGLPVDPATRLLAGWLTAVRGPSVKREQLRARAADRHSRITGEFPGEPDAARFGRVYRADDPVAMRTM
jgi:hypothetical protein